MSDKKLIYDITEFQYKREIPKRVAYPFFSLNKITGGGEIGSLDIIFGLTNSGKSSLILYFITNWIGSGEKVCAMLGEHTMKKAQSILYKQVSYLNKDKWTRVDYGKDKDGKDLGIYETFVSEEDEKNAIELFRDKLYLYDTRNGFSLDDILKAFEEGIKKGCSVFILDNAMMLSYEGVASELREQTDNTEKLRQWAKANQVIVYLIAHSRKIEVSRIRLIETDIAGSSNISNKATTIITVTRTNTLNPNTKEYKDYAKLLELNYIDIKKCDAVLEVVKEKNGIGTGFVGLKWYDSSKTYREVYDQEMINKKEQDRKNKVNAFATKDENTITEPSPVLYTQELVETNEMDDIFSELGF